MGKARLEYQMTCIRNKDIEERIDEVLVSIFTNVTLYVQLFNALFPVTLRRHYEVTSVTSARNSKPFTDGLWRIEGLGTVAKV